MQQTITGKITDEYRQTLAGASVVLFGEGQRYLSTTLADGSFAIDKVLVGRYVLQASFVGYGQYEEEIVLNYDRPRFVEIVLKESVTQLAGVTVTDSLNFHEPGARTITIEKTMRVPANFFDPVRMVTSYPGVVATNDQSNSISVKGFSPNALLWRLQGLDIVNPNHLANAGTFSDKPAANGGGVNVLSAQLLDKTDFYSGNLPVQYGNALSGAINMSLRAGDKNQAHYTLQTSLIGLDAAAEAPVVKGRSSILANYRYSTVGLLSNLGVNFGGEQINFQDFSFHYDHDQNKNARLSIFGFGGLSFNRFKRKPQTEWLEEKDRYDIDFDGKVFGVGFTEELPLSPKAIVKFGSAFSGQFQERSSESSPVLFAHLVNINYQNNKTVLSAFVSSTVKVNESIKTEFGAYVTNIDQQVLNEEVRINYSALNLTNNYKLKVNSWLWQPYVNMNWKISSRVSAESGFRLVYLNKAFAEPRVKLNYQSQIGSFHLTYGVTHQYQPQVGLAAREDQVVKSEQSALSYQGKIAHSWSIASSLYYFRQLRVPVNSFLNYSALNSLEEIPVDFLTADGKGRNYGWDVWLEKKFRDLSFLSGGVSLYRSEYQIDKGYQSSRFDGRFTVNAMGGKEWIRKKNVLSLNLRLLYLGGFRERPIDPFLSPLTGTTYFIASEGFSKQLPNYFRTDLRLSWRKNKPRYTRTVSVDIQNLTGYQNVAYRYYDTFLQTVKTKYQLSLIPVLVYRIDF